MNAAAAKQLAVRAALTFIDVFLGVLVASPLLKLDVSILQTAAAAALPAAITVVRTGLAQLGVPVPNTLPATTSGG